MINLLPPDLKEQIRYAKLNSLVLRYLRITIVVAVVLAGIFAGALYEVNQQTAAITASLAARQASINGLHRTFLPQAQSVSDRLTAIKYVQSTQTHFSAVVADLAKVLPQGVSIDTMTLTGNDKAPVNLAMTAQTYDEALAVRNALATSPRIADADLQSISSNTTSAYQVVVVIAFKPGGGEVKPKQFFFVSLGAIAVILALSGVGYYFALTTLKADANNESAQLALQSQDQNQIGQLKSLQNQYEKEIVPIIPLINEALPMEKKQTEILAQLQNIATGVGLTITTISMPSPVGLPTNVSQTIKSGTVLALPISFQLSGSYQQLQSFTQQVENLNRFTDITNLAISRPDKTQPIVYSISLNAYIMP